EAQSIEPNTLLQTLANRTGVPIRIGNVRKNFYWNEEIRIDDPSRPLLTGERLPEDYYSLMLLSPQRDENGQHFRRVVVAYMIDLAEYRRLL
ncbi:MAG: hypothetical protein M3M87_02355, partial [Thermoproteota archaeon]|nr:hypothetical protein [Thermoproteota archaeon]